MEHGDSGEQDFSEAVTLCIATMCLDSTTVMVALFPLTAHAALDAGLSKEEFMQTAALTFDGIQKRFGG